ncbi:hypothetical protein V8E52_004861 [Russula decolorans]|jgi:hypothetical protein
MAPAAPASASHSHRQPYEYLDALLTAIPNDTIPPEITASQSQGGAGAHHPYSKFIDTALRLASGGPARPDDAPQTRDAWLEIQTSLQRSLHALHPSTTTTSSSQQPAKRKHSPSSSLPNTINNNTDNNKKPKYEDGGEDDKDDDDDVPQLTLHAISATAPVRHKVDITLHARTLRLAHSTTRASTARCARTALTHVFLLPTRARSSGALQWTALLLAGDKPAPPAPRGGGAGGKEAKAKAKATAAAAVRFELACSVPDSSNPATIPRMTVHAPTSSSSSTPTSKVTSAREGVFTLLSSTISGHPVALTTVERGAPLAGITAFRGVRETSLWFFDGDGANANAAGAAGILTDGRPAEFWALEDLAHGESGVRVRTATGRTCSVVLMRRRSGDDGTGEGDGEEEEEEEGEETEFQMIDGKERERILEWVRRHRGAFGIAKKIREEDDDEAQAQAPRGATNGGGDPDSDSDSDFEESEESDGGSPYSSSGSDVGEDEPRSEGGSGSGSESGNESGGEDDDDDDEEITMALDDPDPDPKHHPLLRAGALPKMSRAAMDAAVELVVGDLVGPGKAPRDAAPSAGSGLALPAGVGAGDDDEEDELED